MKFMLTVFVVSKIQITKNMQISIAHQDFERTIPQLCVVAHDHKKTQDLVQNTVCLHRSFS